MNISQKYAALDAAARPVPRSSKGLSRQSFGKGGQRLVVTTEEPCTMGPVHQRLRDIIEQAGDHIVILVNETLKSALDSGMALDEMECHLSRGGKLVLIASGAEIKLRKMNLVKEAKKPAEKKRDAEAVYWSEHQEAYRGIKVGDFQSAISLQRIDTLKHGKLEGAVITSNGQCCMLVYKLSATKYVIDYILDSPGGYVVTENLGKRLNSLNLRQVSWDGTKKNNKISYPNQTTCMRRDVPVASNLPNTPALVPA